MEKVRLVTEKGKTKAEEDRWFGYEMRYGAVN